MFVFLPTPWINWYIFLQWVWVFVSSCGKCLTAELSLVSILKYVFLINYKLLVHTISTHIINFIITLFGCGKKWGEKENCLFSVILLFVLQNLVVFFQYKSSKGVKHLLTHLKPLFQYQTIANVHHILIFFQMLLILHFSECVLTKNNTLWLV